MYKSIVIILVCFFVSGCERGNPDTKTKPSQDMELFCDSIGSFAEGVMRLRQQSALMSDILNKIETPSDGVNTNTRSMMKSLVKDAYASPLLSAEKNKESAIREFKNDAHLSCLNSL